VAIKKNYDGVEGVLSDGNSTVMLVPSGEVEALADITAALLNGASAVDITYDLTTDGYTHTPSNEEIVTNRFTRPYETKREGKQTDTLSLQYNYDPEATESQADSVIVTGSKYHIIERRGVAHDEDFKAGHKVRIFPARVGRKTDDPPAAGAEFSRTVPMLLAGQVIDEYTLPAGA